MPPEPGVGGAGFTAIVLAAQRAGQIDPLAREYGVTHKCLVPICGAALIVHVAAALQATPGLLELRIVVEPEAQAAVRAALRPGPAPIAFVSAADNLADSVYAGAEGVDQPMVITTADNVLLGPPAVLAMLDAMANGADAALAMARKHAVMEAHPEGQRRYYRFCDDEYSNCNLYAMRNRRALAAAETFRSGGQFAKQKARLIGAIGLINLVLLRLGKLSLAGAVRRVGKRFKLRVEPVVLSDGAYAIDVDNRRTYDAASALLDKRRVSEPALPDRL